MGREWYRAAGGRTSEPKKDAKTAWWGGGNSRSKSVTKETSSDATVAGCMNVVFHLFDFHHFRFPDTSEIENDDSLPKGVEAPRNSLESTEEAPLSPIRRDDHLNLSIKTKPTRSSELESLTSNESSYSPTTKTPTLVARLMGLDLLPDKSLISPSSSPTTCSSAFSVDLGTPNLRTRRTQGKRHKHHSLRRNSVDGGTRSLPETPRISLGRRSDADCYQQRLTSSSLHINRHDTNVSESEQEHGHVRFSSSRLKEMKTNDDKENPSPRKYASQIVMQLEEGVSRRMGSDITNTMRNKEQARDHHHHHNDSKKASKNTSNDSSPRLRFLENQKAKPPPPSQTNVAQIVEDKPRLWRVKEEPQPKLAQEEEQKQERETRRKAVKKCKKPAENEMKFGSRLVKPPQTMQEEPFVRSPVGNQSSNSSNHHHHHHHHQGDKKCKKTPLSNELLNLTSVPCLLPVKKKDPSNLYGDVLKVTKTQPPRNRSEFLRCRSQTQTYVVRKDILTNTTSFAAAASSSSSEELDYITRIFRRTGIDKNTPISHAKWFSPSHPLDPSIFYSLEHFAITSARTKSSPENLGLRYNRKLLFHLADEILIDVLKPHMNMKPWVGHYPILYRRDLRGSELIDELCRKIGEFPLSDCQVLGDIDALVAGDLPETKRRRQLAFEEEGEAVVTELERQILETLVSETTMDCVRVTKRCRFWEWCQCHVMRCS
ncbi:PREDICTED: uncharacterized protein LOC104818268 [Tarenaya hassleriana]|uniref:uncharacterized protein LOC104818268 n=1 Tax=Tarenaya hassleriana TaxID=28532 RepID=UPI00053C2132|nr:PREDICTED: uncharacterized protein LOC104818268 [Tarenaya hassleriana]